VDNMSYFETNIPIAMTVHIIFEEAIIQD